MRLLTILSCILFMNSGLLAQKRKVENLKSSQDSLSFRQKYLTQMEVGTRFMTNLKKGYGFETYFSPGLSYFPSQSLRLNLNAVLGSVNYHNMTLVDYYSTHRLTGLGHYFGVSGEGTYKINERVFITSGGFAEKLPDLEPVGNKFENRINYGGSFLVGYKFSDKVSIQAGIGVQRIYDPWNVNPFLNNHGLMP